MLSVLLVDDEPGAIKALKYAIDWEQEGFRIIGEAADGEQALDILKEQSCAVVFSDIRMPGMDGIALMKELQDYPRTHAIAVSGYDEFEYAKQCLKFGVRDYLLKPCKEEDLLPLIRKIKTEIESDIVRDKQRTFGIQATRSDAVRQWVLGCISFEEAKRMLQWCGIQVPAGGKWIAIAAEPDPLDLGDSRLTAREWQTTTFAVRNVLEELARPAGSVFEDEQGRLGLVLATDGLTQAATAELVRSFRDAVMRYTKVPVTFGIGTPANAPEDAPASYKTALAMLERKFMLGAESVILPDMFTNGPGDIGEANRQFVADMLRAFKEERSDAAYRLLDGQVEVWKRSGSSKTDVQAVVVEWMVGLYQDARQYGEQGERFFQDKAAAGYRAILQSRSLDELIRIARQAGEEWFDFLEKTKWNQPSHPVNEIKQLVEVHYAEPISLKSLAGQIHMNAAYLGQLFKASEGISFNDYLLQLRMNKARQLLERTDLKVYEVASAVGYKQLDWFYKKFKETFGTSANEFRCQSKLAGTPSSTS